MKKLIPVLAGLGVLLAAHAISSRFIGGPTAFGYIIPEGISPRSAMIGANTLLLLAIVIKLLCPCQEKD